MRVCVVYSNWFIKMHFGLVVSLIVVARALATALRAQAPLLMCTRIKNGRFPTATGHPLFCWNLTPLRPPYPLLPPPPSHTSFNAYFNDALIRMDLLKYMSIMLRYLFGYMCICMSSTKHIRCEPSPENMTIHATGVKWKPEVECEGGDATAKLAKKSRELYYIYTYIFI